MHMAHVIFDVEEGRIQRAHPFDIHSYPPWKGIRRGTWHPNVPPGSCRLSRLISSGCAGVGLSEQHVMSETRREEHVVPNRDANVAVTGASSDEAHIDSLLDQLTLEEKASLTGGHDLWHLPPIARLGLGRLNMSDGPSGVRGARFIDLSLIHISEPTRLGMISYAV